jgi:hypothetical protein
LLGIKEKEWEKLGLFKVFEFVDLKISRNNNAFFRLNPIFTQVRFTGGLSDPDISSLNSQVIHIYYGLTIT